MSKRYEVELFRPVEKYFTKLGYNIQAEVNNCDVVAIKDDEFVIIELKRSINMTLLMQATKRQRLTDHVYIAIPKPSYSLRTRKWRDICHLLRRLELGLLIVTFEGECGEVEMVQAPKPFNRKRSMSQSKKTKQKLLREVAGRSENYNVGGSHQRKIHTAYKESSIHIACCLVYFGPLSPKRLRELGTGDKTSSILQNNHYGWFERIRRGVYQITDTGLEQHQSNPVISDKYYKQLKNLC